MARCLATGSTKTIGIVCVDIRNYFYSYLVETIENVAKENGYFITLILTHNDPKREREGIEYLAQRHVDGLILFPIGQGEEFIHELRLLNIPIVTIYNRISKDFVHVDVDCRKIMRNAVSYLVGKNYERVIYLGVGIKKLREKGLNTFSLDERIAGYIEGVNKELNGNVVILDRLDEHKLVNLVLDEKDKKTAVLCPFDLVAMNALNIFKNHNIKVPEQVGIMGFDNIHILNYITPRISTVDCNIHTLGRKAFSILQMLLNDEKDVSDCVIDYSFVEGESL